MRLAVTQVHGSQLEAAMAWLLQGNAETLEEASVIIGTAGALRQCFPLPDASSLLHADVGKRGLQSVLLCALLRASVYVCRSVARSGRLCYQSLLGFWAAHTAPGCVV